MDINEEIFQRAKVLMRGELKAEAEPALEEMCLAAYSELSVRLKDGIYIEKVREQFVRAAAILGLSMFIESDPNSVEAFFAGNVRVKKQNAAVSIGSASALRKQAELMMIGFLKERSFSFRAVRA